MDLISTPTGSADPVAEVRRLRRELRRERARRRAAEAVEARVRAGLYDSVRELRSAQADLLDRPGHPNHSEAVDELHTALTQDLAAGDMVNRVAESVGRALGVDRCDVLPVDDHRYSSVQGTWSGSEEVARLPRARSFVDLPEPLTTLLFEAAQRREPLRVDHVDDDPRLGHERAREIVDALGVRALAAVP